MLRLSMTEPKTLTQGPDDLEDEIAWTVLDCAYLLPEAPCKGRLRPGDCGAISRRVIERLRLRCVVELRRRVTAAHSWPPMIEPNDR